MMLNAFVKLAGKFPELRNEISMLLQIQTEHFNPDIQQRSVEYLALLNTQQHIISAVLQKCPPYTDDLKNNNPLLRKLYQLKLGNMKDQLEQVSAKQLQRPNSDP